MITTRLATINPHRDHKYKSVTIISVVNYDKFQYVDKEQPHTDHISQQGLNNILIKQTKLGSSKDKVVNNGYKHISDWGEYKILMKDGIKYKKHKWKDEPLSEYK